MKLNKFAALLKDTRERLKGPLEKAVFEAFCTDQTSTFETCACYKCQHATIGLVFQKNFQVPEKSIFQAPVLACSRMVTFAAADHDGTVQLGLNVPTCQPFFCSGALEAEE